MGKELTGTVTHKGEFPKTGNVGPGQPQPQTSIVTDLNKGK